MLEGEGLLKETTLEVGAIEHGDVIVAHAFVDELAAMIAEEKDRLKESLVSGDVESPETKADVSEKLDELSFEVGEMRGRLESLQNSLDAMLDQRDDGTGD